MWHLGLGIILWQDLIGIYDKHYSYCQANDCPNPFLPHGFHLIDLLRYLTELLICLSAYLLKIT